MYLEFQHMSLDSWVLLTLTCDVEMASAPKLRQEVASLVAKGRYYLILDMTAVDFIDSTGLGVLVGALRRVRVHGGDLALVCPDFRLKNVFRSCDLDRIFALHDTVDEALGVGK